MSEKLKPYSKAIVKLLKGVVEKKSNPTIWNDILTYQYEIQEYLDVIGLELILKKDEGFGFLKQAVFEDDTTMNLVSRRSIEFEPSVVMVVLRQILEEFDNSPTETQTMDKIITSDEIKDRVRLFLSEMNNTVKFEDKLDGSIQKVAELGFLKKIGESSNETRYKIHRIIKEKITIDNLNNYKEQLKDYGRNV